MTYWIVGFLQVTALAAFFLGEADVAAMFLAQGALLVALKIYREASE